MIGNPNIKIKFCKNKPPDFWRKLFFLIQLITVFLSKNLRLSACKKCHIRHLFHRDHTFFESLINIKSEYLALSTTIKIIVIKKAFLSNCYWKQTFEIGLSLSF
jgi:hypothetical protein